MQNTSETLSPLPAKDRGELFLARLIFAWQQLFARPVVDYVPQPMQVYDIPAAAGHVARPAQGARSIPRIIWAFWTGPKCPDLIQRCFANWREMCPDFDIRILDEQSVLQYVDAIPPQLNGAIAPKRADWIRVELLARYGGIWVDASTILTRSLDWVIEEQARTNADFVGYYLKRFTRDADYPVVENWFLAAPPQSPFICDLRDEFTDRVIIGSNEEYMATIQREGIYDLVRQNIESPTYLSMHLALQYVLRMRGGYRLALECAEKGPFLYHDASGWSRTNLKIQLMMRPAAKVLPAIVKLRKPDRRRLDLYVARKLVRADSILGRFLLRF